MSERDKFMTRFADKRASGLVDIKFLVQNGDAMSKDDFFAAANLIDAAIADPDKHRTLKDWDGDPEPVASHLLA